MASRNISTKTTAERLAGLLNTYYAKKSDLTQITTDVGNAIKAATYASNTLKLFRSTDTTGEAAFSFDLPEEMFLDQNKTAFVGKFKWSEEAYPGSTNPNLENKPVMVLAVKGDGDTVAYSFLNMAALVDTYSPKAGNGSATVTVDGYEISVNVNISDDEDNILTTDENGKLKVVAPDVSSKANKLTAEAASEDNILVRSATGDLKDGGKTIADLAEKPATATSGNIAEFDENKNPVDGGVAVTDLQQKLASGSFTEGNIRKSNAQGFAEDGGIAVGDILTSADIGDYTEAELRTLLGLPAAD